jgi:hypothetical protein
VVQRTPARERDDVPRDRTHRDEFIETGAAVRRHRPVRRRIGRRNRRALGLIDQQNAAGCDVSEGAVLQIRDVGRGDRAAARRGGDGVVEVDDGVRGGDVQDAVDARRSRPGGRGNRERQRGERQRDERGTRVELYHEPSIAMWSVSPSAGRPNRGYDRRPRSS